MKAAYKLIATAAAVSLLGACSGNDETGGTRRAGGARRETLAPIEGAAIVVRESSPPQYAVRVTSGLPSGCAAFERIDVERDGAVVELTVWNTLPANDNMACTMIYGTTDNIAELGSDFESGRTYEVRINGDSRVTLTAQ